MPLIFRSPLSAAALDTLAAHQYKSGSYTVLDAILNRWWEVAVTFIPLWMAPNVITLLGTLAMLSTVLLMHSYLSAGALLPAWLHLYTSACIFFYQSMDAIDGKQARRTGSSSPLGQLFDHGCDAFVAGIFVHNAVLALGLHPADPEAVALALSCLLLFYFSQWEEDFTRTLRTNAGGYGVSEGQLSMMVTHIITAVWGVGVWQLPLAVTLRVGEHTGAVTTTLAHVIVGSTLLTTGAAVTRFIVNVTLYRGHGVVALLAAAPVITATAALILVALPTPVHSTLQASHPQVLLLMYTLSVTLVSTQTIVHSMARQPLMTHDTAACYILPALLAVDVLVGERGAHALTWAMYASLAAICVAYASFVAAAMSQISRRLGIHAFRITPRGEDGRRDGAVSAAPPQLERERMNGATTSASARGRGRRTSSASKGKRS